MDLRDILLRMEKAKEEMLRIQKRLDMLIALANQDLTNRKDELTESVLQKKEVLSETIEMRMEDGKRNIEDKLEKIKELAVTKPNSYLDSIRNELWELKEKYRRNEEERECISTLRDFFQRELLRANPTMSSVRFKEALEELKKRAEEWKRK